MERATLIQLQQKERPKTTYQISFLLSFFFLLIVLLERCSYCFLFSVNLPLPLKYIFY